MSGNICLKRENGSASGKLLLPDAHETDTANVSINGTSIQIRFGNIFNVVCSTPNHIPVIPNFGGGMLRGELERRTGKTFDDYELKIQYVDTGIPIMPHAILYVYDTNTHRLEDELEEIASVCPDGSTLVFPTIGVNNGMSCHQSAFNMFYSMVSCLEDTNSHLHKLSGIIVTTLFGQQESAGTRTIRHMFNLVNVYNKTTTNKVCAICATAKVDTILECGHHVMCSRCVIDMKQHESRCPICRVQIRCAYPCYTAEDSHDHVCCQQDVQKEMKICVPCGHYGFACVDCGREIETHKKCPICDEDVFAYIPYFDS